MKDTHGRRSPLWPGPLLAGCLLLLVFSLGCGREESAPRGGEEKSREVSSAPETSSPTSDPELLLARAIQALGGRERLSAVEAFETRFVATQPGVVMRGRMRQRIPDCFRLEQDVWNAHLVHVIHGREAWKTIDGVHMAVEDYDRRQMEEQGFLARMSLLVGLLDDETVEIKGLGVQDGFEWIEVAVKHSDLGPYQLGFDRKEVLLRRVRFKTDVYGRRDRVDLTLRLEDYRNVGGIMVPFSASYLMQGQEVIQDMVEEIIVNPEPDASLFIRPDAEGLPEIIERRTRTFDGLVIQGFKDDPARLDKRIESLLREANLERTGPWHLLYETTDDETCRAVCPVVRKKAPATRPSGSERPRVDRIEGRDVLTVVVKDPTPDRLRAAEKRLRERARSLGRNASGRIRDVVWSHEIRQMQLVLD